MPDTPPTETSSRNVQGYDAMFEPDIDRKYICPVCLAALRDPMQTSCGHRFCKSCILGVVNGRVYAKCPVDNVWLKTDEELFDDNAVRREVLSLIVKCDNQDDGCDWKGELRSLEGHDRTCPFTLMSCYYGCGASVLRQDLTNHLDTCDRRLVSCEHCQLQIAYGDITKHQLLICQKFPVRCTLCGQTGICRGAISQHIDVTSGDCPSTIVPCQFASFGCCFQDKRSMLPQHYNEGANHHIMLLVQQVSEQQRRISLLEAELPPVRQTASAVKDSEQASSRLLQEHSNTLDEHGAILKHLHNSSFTGRLHWKIPIADQTRAEQFLSKSFYTGVPGYKICACLELNGHTEGTDRYASFFIILEEGEYDSQLKFPFNSICNVTVSDQSETSSSRDHYTVTIHCTDIQRRLGDDSIGNGRRGRIKFMKTEELVSDRFFRDGFLYIDINVDSALRPPHTY
ncbi:hypothetical protein ScPMuIL_004670 [Solemya velum]